MNEDGTDPGPWTSAPIAICLSGGGYRAAAFHLGTLAYLNRVGLLGNVSVISTVSGGTFTGAMYTLSLIEQEPFEAFFNRYYALMRDTNLVALGLNLLREPARTPAGKRNLIVSMAEVYAETFFKKPDGRPYRLGDILSSPIALPEVSFNATEFRTGVAFRFQSRAGSVIGNGNVKVSASSAAEIRVADIVAASSCFPGGFEPMAFPDDFAWPNGKIPPDVVASLSSKGLPPRVALMDGGIYDNQGAQTLDLAVYKQADQLGMFVISDVDSDSDDLYPYPEIGAAPGWIGRRTLGQVWLLLMTLSVICGLSLLTLSFQLWKQVQQGAFTFFWDFFLYLVPALLAGSTFALLVTTRYLAKHKVLPLVPQVGIASWDNLKHLSLDQFLDMLYLRLSSLVKMSSSVFMKRIRRLVYDRIYRDDRYSKKRVDNLIYELKSAKSPGQGVEPPSIKLVQLSERASATPTALWFDSIDQLDDLAACGQATTCFKLMAWTVQRFGDPDGYPADVAALWKALIEDWAVLRDKPDVLLGELRASAVDRQDGREKK